MKRRSRWTCLRIKKCFYKITETELNERLANLWEILIKGESQFDNRSPVPVLNDTKDCLSNPLTRRRGR